MTTALIVTYESMDVIEGCIESAYAAGISDIVVWDNSKTGATRELLDNLKDDRLRVFYDGVNHGFGGGINRAFGQVRHTGPVLLLNPDCRISKTALDALESSVRNDPSCIVAPRMLYVDGSFGISGGPLPTLVKEILALTQLDRALPRSAKLLLLQLFGSRTAGRGTIADTLAPGSPIEMDWVSGFCIMLERKAFERIGGFDEEFFLYFEDVDFCVRARQAGLGVTLVREAIVLHFESTSTGPRGKSKAYRRGMSTYFETHGSPAQMRIARMIARVS